MVDNAAGIFEERVACSAQDKIVDEIGPEDASTYIWNEGISEHQFVIRELQHTSAREIEELPFLAAHHLCQATVNRWNEARDTSPTNLLALHVRQHTTDEQDHGVHV